VILRRLLFVLLALLASWGVRAQGDVVTERGLRHSTRDRDLASDAIGRASRLLAGTGIALASSWSASGSSPGAALVYLVEATDGAFDTPAAVPEGCRCIFVNAAVLDRWVAHNSSGSSRWPLDKGNFLVFVLLHEAGHLHRGTAAAVMEQGQLSLFNLDPSRAKAAEEDADDFAAEVLRRQAGKARADAEARDAAWIAIELTKMSWNMQAFRTLDEFGAFAVGKPSVFLDNGYSHPNLAWRILRVNNAIQESESTRYLLHAFEEAQQRGLRPAPLYRGR